MAVHIPHSPITVAVTRKQLLRRFPLTRKKGIPIMARRRRGPPIQEGCLTGHAYESARDEIVNKLRQELVTTNPLPFTATQLIDNAVPGEIRTVMTKAMQYLEGYHYGRGVIPSNTRDVEFIIDFSKHDILVPQARFLTIRPPLCDKVVAWTDAALAIQAKWAAVSHVLGWLHTRATLSAIRYYWPAIMSLLPADSAELSILLRTSVGGKYKEPPGIGRVLHMLRATATTVAAAQLLPDFAPLEDNKGVQVSLAARERVEPDYHLEGRLMADGITLDM